MSAPSLMTLTSPSVVSTSSSVRGDPSLSTISISPFLGPGSIFTSLGLSTSEPVGVGAGCASPVGCSGTEVVFGDPPMEQPSFKMDSPPGQLSPG